MLPECTVSNKIVLGLFSNTMYGLIPRYSISVYILFVPLLRAALMMTLVLERFSMDIGTIVDEPIR